MIRGAGILAAPGWLVGVGVFLGLFAALLLAALAVSVASWWRLRRLGTPLPYGQFMSLRWRGVDVTAIAAAHWTAVQLGRSIPLEDWASFAIVGVDVVQLAAAMTEADRLGVEASFGVLGAAALAGFDPQQVVRTAADRGVRELTAEHLARLEQWGLHRRGRGGD